jgi:hypothetical protein
MYRTLQYCHVFIMRSLKRRLFCSDKKRTDIWRTSAGGGIMIELTAKIFSWYYNERIWSQIVIQFVWPIKIQTGVNK